MEEFSSYLRVIYQDKLLELKGQKKEKRNHKNMLPYINGDVGKELSWTEFSFKLCEKSARK